MKLSNILVLVLGLVSSSYAFHPPTTADSNLDLKDASFLMSPQGDEIRIPIERCYDVQWNPPGYPVLNASYLDVPYKDRTEATRNGYYTFVTKGGMTYFVRKKLNGSIYKVFENVQFILISNDVLMFESEGYYGTLIKGIRIPADDSYGSWSTEKATVLGAENWLAANFAVPSSCVDRNSTTAPFPTPIMTPWPTSYFTWHPTSTPVPTSRRTPWPTSYYTRYPTPIMTPQGSSHFTWYPTPEITMSPVPQNISFLLTSEGAGIHIPLDRCYDVQWNPPGHPMLNTWYLDVPYKDRTEATRNGYYTFMVDDYGMTYFVRKKSDGSIYHVFQEVEFILISNDVLMFESEGYYGTLIKGINITADDSEGSWATKTSDRLSAIKWLAANFAVPLNSTDNTKPVPTIAPSAFGSNITALTPTYDSSVPSIVVPTIYPVHAKPSIPTKPTPVVSKHRS